MQIPTLKRRALALALVTLVGLVGAALVGAESPAAAPSAAKPNIIVIETDDQTLEAFRSEVMPATVKLLAGNGGTTFTNNIVTTPLCCPSRVSYLTGQYGHNNGVLSNRTGYGALTDRSNVLPTWLQDAGYVTAHVGKWLHQYETTVKPKTKVAPGWDEWYTALEPRAYYDYKLYINGKKKAYGDRKRDHLTNVLGHTALQLLDKYIPKPQPLYLQLDEYAPHSGPGAKTSRCKNAAVPAPADDGKFKNVELPKPPNFNEQDLSDKPSFIQELPDLGADAIAAIQRHYQCDLESLVGVDNTVKKIWRMLGKAGERDNTVFVFTSDNGYFFGEHRLPASKFRIYEEALRVPLVVHVPTGVLGSTAVSEVSQPVANIDLAPTLLDLAGAEPCKSAGNCRIQDGRSLLDLMRGDSSSWPSDRGLVVEFKEKGVPSELTASCEFFGIRTASDIYVQHPLIPDSAGTACKASDEAELYDLQQDPFELKNLFPAQPGSPEAAVEQALKARLAELRNCAGIAGRDPQPPNGHYCD
jgi:N-acetylglucosamine-6-sulfatase